MGLFNIFEKKPQDFAEYARTVSGAERTELMNQLARFGDPFEVLNELINTPPCCLNGELDVRINENYLFEFKKKKPTNSPRTFLYKMNSIRYCYHNLCRNSKLSEVGYLTPFGNASVFGLSKEESLAVYSELKKHAQGFERLPGKESKDGELFSSFDRLHYYFFEGDTLCSRTIGEFTKKETDGVVLSNIQEVMWCEQWSSIDSDSSDTYALDLYTLAAKKPVTLYVGSELGAFLIAMELKKRVPHLLYGPSEEYKAIFKRDPAELMALAKNKANAVF